MRKEIKILLSSYSFISLATGLITPIYAVFVEQIGGDLLTAGSAYSLYAFAAGVLIYLLGKWEDHINHLEVLVIIGYMLHAIGFFGYTLVSQPAHLFVVQGIFGLGMAIMSPAYDALYSKHLEKGKFASQWGAWESMAWIVASISALAGGYIANTYGFRTLFVVMFVLSILGVFLSLLLLMKKKN